MTVDGPGDLRVPRRTSPLGALVDVVSVDGLRSAVPALVVAVSVGRVAVVLALGVVVAVASSVVSWSRRLWSFDGAVLHLDEGVFVRNQRRIPVERIQHVELERRLRHQLLGLAALRVETAGASGAELRLDAITLAEAEALREVLLRARDLAAERTDDPEWDVERHGPVPPPAPPAEEVLVRLPPTRLLLAGITGPEVLAVLASLAFLLDALVDLGIDPGELGSLEARRPPVLALALAGVPLWLALAGLVGLVRRWDLTASVRGGELRVAYGLLQRHELVVRTDRVQDAQVSQRLLLRPFGRADLRLRSAASGRGDASRADIPLLAPAELDRILGRVLPAAVPRPALAPAPAAARRRALARGGLLSALLASAVVALAWATTWTLLVLLVLVLPLGPALGELSYRGLGWAEREAVQHSRVGALGRRTAIVPAARVQSAAVVASWFQRRRGLATTRLDLAGAAVGVPDRELAECRRIAASTTAV